MQARGKATHLLQCCSYEQVLEKNNAAISQHIWSYYCLKILLSNHNSSGTQGMGEVLCLCAEKTKRRQASVPDVQQVDDESIK